MTFCCAKSIDSVARYTPRSTPEYGRVFYERQYVGGAWRPWYAFSAQRVDKTAGIAIYTWDDVAGRDQLIHGDTGRRNIAADALNGWNVQGQLNLRRVGYTVHLLFGYLNPSAATSDVVAVLPAGFRPPANSEFPVRCANGLGYVEAQNGGNLQAPRSLGIVGPAARIAISYQTAESWPTALPGTADGAIPF